MSIYTVSQIKFKNIHILQNLKKSDQKDTIYFSRWVK